MKLSWFSLPCSLPLTTCSSKLGACSAALWLFYRDSPWRHPQPCRPLCLKTVPLHAHPQCSSIYSSAPPSCHPAPPALGIHSTGCELGVQVSSPHAQIQLSTQRSPGVRLAWPEAVVLIRMQRFAPWLQADISPLLSLLSHHPWMSKSLVVFFLPPACAGCSSSSAAPVQAFYY